MRYPKENASENRFLKNVLQNVLKTGGLKLVFYKTFFKKRFWMLESRVKRSLQVAVKVNH